MLRIESLHQDPSFARNPTGTSSDLRQQLVSAFFCPKILNVQHRVGTRHGHQFNIFEVQTFGDHLGADQNISFAFLQFFVEFFIGIFATHRVHIHAINFSIRKKPFGFLVNLLNAHAAHIQVLRMAPGTNGRLCRLVAAVMAFHLVGGLMVSHHHITIGAVGYVTATLALHHIRIATAVMQYHGVHLFIKLLLNRFNQGLRETAENGFCVLLFLEIYKFKLGNRNFTISLA